QAAGNWSKMMAPLYERRGGPREIELEPGIGPGSRWRPVVPGQKSGPTTDRFTRSAVDPGPLPNRDEDIAFAPVTKLSRWIHQRQLTSQRLTQIYLKRIKQFDPKLRCVITLAS